MQHTIVGLGNPDDEYKGTRHNLGRAAVQFFAEKNDFSEWKHEKKANALVAKGEIGGHKITCILPEVYMNKSGQSVAYFVKNAKAAERTIVVYDELDLPFGGVKLAFGRGSGGHKGIESIVRALKTKDFVRVRLGISASTPSGKLKKVQGEDNVQKFILGTFSKKEQSTVDAILKHVNIVLQTVALRGRAQAMNEFN